MIYIPPCAGSVWPVAFIACFRTFKRIKLLGRFGLLTVSTSIGPNAQRYTRKDLVQQIGEPTDLFFSLFNVFSKKKPPRRAAFCQMSFEEPQLATNNFFVVTKSLASTRTWYMPDSKLPAGISTVVYQPLTTAPLYNARTSVPLMVVTVTLT